MRIALRTGLLLPGLVALALLGTACGGSGTNEDSPSASSGASEPLPPPGQPTESELPTARAIDDARAAELMDALVSDRPSTASSAVQEIVAAGDQRFIAVFIELVLANRIGLARGAGRQENLAALESLSGEGFGIDWPSWIEWYGGTSFEPPPGFTGWKGRLLGRIDHGFADFLSDDARSSVRVEEVMWGGVAVDGIPALDNARMVAPADADYLEPGEPVFGLAFNGDSRAYPLRILDWHEMANDVVGGVPVSLAYCTLCGAGVAYDGRVSDGTTYTFGSSGFLFRSNKLMYDRQTRTLWNQFTGEPVIGELVGSGIRLEKLPVVLTTWQDWLRQHPDTVVLDIVTGFDRPYVPGSAYGDYFAAPATMFPVWQRRDDLKTKARVFGLQLDGVPKAYPVERLVAEKVVNDALAGTSVVLVSTRGGVEVEGESRRVGPVTYDAGAEVRAYERGERIFGPGPVPDVLRDEQGRTWEVTEDALVGPDGESAPRLPGHLAYWFGWYAFFPRTLVYGEA